MKYELVFKTYMNSKDIIEFLNLRAMDDWELVTIIPQRVLGDDCYNYIFKKY